MVQKFKITKAMLEKSAHWPQYPFCAVELALQEVYPNVGVGETFYHFYDIAQWGCLPQHIIDFIIEFDDLQPAKRIELPELEFELDITPIPNENT